MIRAYCFLSAVPMRREPSDRAEMVNQLLLDDTFVILNQQEKWSLIRCDLDRQQTVETLPRRCQSFRWP